MTRLALIVISVVVATGTAHAEPEMATVDGRSPAMAVTLSLAPTLVSAAAFGAGLATKDDDRAATLLLSGTAGLVLSPSIGHWYGNGNPFTVGSAIRYAGVGAMMLGLVVAATSGLGETFTSEPDTGLNTGASVLIYGGMGALAVGAVYDIATVHGATERGNARRARRFQLGPTALSTKAGPTMGLGVVGTF